MARYRQWKLPPLSREEWRAVRRYRRIPIIKRLAMLDGMRAFLFAVWRENPSIYRTSLKFRRGEI